MKAAIYQGIKNVELKEIDKPVIGDNDVLLKNIYAGICGSDVNAYNHGGQDVMIFEGLEFGHEMVSRVVEKGKNVTDVEIGDRLFPVPSEVRKEKMARAATAGGFSEYLKAVDFKLGLSAVKVPEEISDKQAAIIEPLLIGCNAVRPLEVEVYKKSIVYGAGPIGLCAAMALKFQGVDVIVCDIIDERLEIASSMGFHTCNTISENYLEKCQSIYGKSASFFGEAIDCDYYVDAAGNQAVMDLFFSGAKFGAKLSIVAVHHKNVSINMVPLTYCALRIVGPNGNYHNNLPLALDILKSHMFDVDKMITHVFKHEDMIKALEQASKPKEALKVLIEY